MTARVTERTLRLHKETALALYERSLATLQRHLSLAAGDPPDADLEASIAADAEDMPDLASALAERFASEPYRRKLAFMTGRVRAARRLNADACVACRGADRRRPVGAGGPVEDAEQVELSRAQDLWGTGAPTDAPRPGDGHVAYGRPDAAPGGRRRRRLCLAPAGSGSSGRRRAARPAVAGSRCSASTSPASTCDSTAPSSPGRWPRCCASPASRPTTGPGRGRRVALLAREIANPRPLIWPQSRYSAETQEALDVFRTVRRLQAELGPTACNVYIISMTAGVSDVLAPLLLAKEAGLFIARAGRRAAAQHPPDRAPLRDHRRPAPQCAT